MRQVYPTPSLAVTSFVERKCPHETHHIPHDHCRENWTEKKVLDVSTGCNLNVPFVATSSLPRISANSTWTATLRVRQRSHRRSIRKFSVFWTTLQRLPMGAVPPRRRRESSTCVMRTTTHSHAAARCVIAPKPVRKPTDWSLQHTPLGVSYLLLSTLLEAQRKLLSQADQLSELAAARDIRDRLTLELEAAQLKYQNSERARDNEKEAALSNEEALRVQYNKMNALWIWSVTRLLVAGSRADLRHFLCSKVGLVYESDCAPRLTCGFRWNRHSGDASLCVKN